MSLPKGLVTLNGNMMASVDVETTGSIPGYHDIVQVCVLPLNEDLDPLPDVSPFYLNIKPLHPERAEKKAMAVNGLDLQYLKTCPTPANAADIFHEWFRSLQLPMWKRIVPLVQNSAFDIPYLKLWLGNVGYGSSFSYLGRDTMFSALALNDSAAWKCRPIPFPNCGLKGLCGKFGIPLDNHHDSLADCIATAKVYRELLKFIP